MWIVPLILDSILEQFVIMRKSMCIHAEIYKYVLLLNSYSSVFIVTIQIRFMVVLI